MRAVARSWQPDPDQGIFETLLVVDGHPVELDAHLARLEASLAALFPGRPTPDLSNLPQAKDAALSSIRIAVAPDGDEALEEHISVRAIEPKATFDPPPVALRGLPLAGGLGPHKWVDRSILDQAEAELSVDTLPLLVDWDGAVLEASRANLFAVRDSTLLTPPADGRILPGVTRARVIEIAAEAGLEVEEASLHREDLLGAEEVFLTGSVRGVERVYSLDGTALTSHGDVALNLRRELLRTWAGAQVG
jgi:para-aminobenzoate synthetase/4-amino-4-deoxychorismate lyase